ncbi:MAG: hypothetical protein ACI9WO_001975 [Sphingobacteriales bacterium]|jgi:hypothetical protein
MNIIRLTRKHINTKKWDDCVNNSRSPLAYGQSAYLDIVCDGWEGLILNNYEGVMPIPKVYLKNLIKVIGQPIFCQQLGVFASREFQHNEMNAWLKAIPFSLFKYRLSFNFSNPPVGEERRNLILDLENPYDTISSKINKNTRRNIKKASIMGLNVRFDGNIDDFKKLHKREVAPMDKALNKKAYIKLKEIYGEYTHRGEAFVAQVSDDEKLLSAILFLHVNNRLIYLAAATLSDYKKSGINHFLVNEVIQKYAGTTTLLDFEGSMIPGVARFFEGFGAVEQNYSLSI